MFFFSKYYFYYFYVYTAINEDALPWLQITYNYIYAISIER